MLAICAKTAENGYTIVDQELDLGLRSIAVPVIQGGRTVAAMNIGMPSARIPMTEVHSRLLPALRKAAAELSAMGPIQTPLAV